MRPHEAYWSGCECWECRFTAAWMLSYVRRRLTVHDFIYPEFYDAAQSL